MTLKKFLKKYIDAFADIYNNGVYLGCSDILDKKYKEWRVDKVFPAYSKSDLRCGIVAINIEPPKKKKQKRSTDNKAYKKWMKKYVKDHMDEIGLKDGGYAGDSADDDGCWNCKYTDLDSGSFPCEECSHAYTDRWESKE